MQLALTDEQRMIQQSAERFLAQVASCAAVRSAMASERGHDPQTWARIARELKRSAQIPLAAVDRSRRGHCQPELHQYAALG